jgi:hypothetical protein
VCALQQLCLEVLKHGGIHLMIKSRNLYTKAYKPINVLVNVVTIVTACIQIPEQQVLKEHELMKAKVASFD